MGVFVVMDVCVPTALHVEEDRFANTVEQELNVKNARVEIYVNMVKENQHVSNAGEAPSVRALGVPLVPIAIMTAIVSNVQCTSSPKKRSRGTTKQKKPKSSPV